MEAAHLAARPRSNMDVVRYDGRGLTNTSSSFSAGGHSLTEGEKETETTSAACALAGAGRGSLARVGWRSALARWENDREEEKRALSRGAKALL